MIKLVALIAGMREVAARIARVFTRSECQVRKLTTRSLYKS